MNLNSGHVGLVRLKMQQLIENVQCVEEETEQNKNKVELQFIDYNLLYGSNKIIVSHLK